MVSTQDVLQRFNGVKPGKPGRWKALCPAHDDHNPSLSIWGRHDGSIGLKCHAGCHLERILEKVGLDKCDLQPQEALQHRPGPSGRSGRSNRCYLELKSAVDAVSKKLGGVPQNVWVYHNAQGDAVGAVGRWMSEGGKEIRPFTKSASGWQIGGMPALRPLFNLPTILTGLPDQVADAPRRVYIVEGEKCCDSLSTIGLLATTSAGGAGAALQTDWSPLAGREVVIFPDNDKPGAKYATSIAHTLSKLDPPGSVRVVNLSDLNKGEDVADWIAARSALSQTQIRAELEAIIIATESLAPQTIGVQQEADESLFEIDDPNRLAMEFLGENHRHPCGRWTLAYWHGEFYLWDTSQYSKVDTAVIKVNIRRSIQARFIHLAQLNVQSWRANSSKGPPPKARRVTTKLVSEVLNAVEAQVLIEGLSEQPNWLEDTPDGFEPSGILATRSALISLPELAAERPSKLDATPLFFSSGCLDFDFDPKATCPEFDRYLRSVFPADHEQDSIDVLQEIAGYCLTPQTRLQRLFLLFGPKRSGKGTFTRILRQLVGEQHYTAPSLSQLSSEFGLQCLLGKTLAVCPDVRLSRRLDRERILEILLSISGEDRVDVNRKHLPIRSAVRLPVRFVLCANVLPDLPDESGAFMSRVIAVQFRQTFVGREDRGLAERLLLEMPGILNWAIRGWMRLQERGEFVQPQSGQELIRRYEELISPVRRFVAERCELTSGATLTPDEIFEAWGEWCKEAQLEGQTSTKESFGHQLRQAFPNIHMRRPSLGGVRQRQYQGIRLK